MELFGRNDVVGVFRGFREGGLEFHADLVMPYRADFQRIPMQGSFILVQLETPDEAVLGRITSFSSEGRLSSSSGEEFNIRAVREERIVPEDLREQYLRYRVNIRVLGVIRRDGDKTNFVPSHRRLPHVGSPVAFPSADLLKEIAGHNIDGAVVGLYALGEYAFAEGSQYADQLEDWTQLTRPAVEIKFPVGSLVSRRTFIFARAGFGKSNLNKLLFSELYRETPTSLKRGGRQVPVGTIIFDPEGEYFWPDDKGRPGLADVPHLNDKLVVFTPRRAPSNFYQAFVAGGVRLDLRRMRPGDVIAIALGPERQEQQNVRKLRGLNQDRWSALVNLVDQHGNQAPLDKITEILDLEQRQEVEALAARGNMTAIVRMLHDRNSQFMDMLMRALSQGKLCVVDVSQMRNQQAMVLSGLILRRIFDHNQEQFTQAEPKTIPTIAVIEEAQTVLQEKQTASEPYIAWVKEGRKYDLGALLVTQQPGSIPIEILSQGDNWFVFHLLASADLTNLQRANAHFSGDLLAALLNEPIPGQGVFWSSVGGSPYPVYLRALLFERMYPSLDADYSRAAEDTYAQELSKEFQEALRQAGVTTIPQSEDEMPPSGDEEKLPSEGPDILETLHQNAIEKLRQDDKSMARLQAKGMAYFGVVKVLESHLPDTLDERNTIAYRLVPAAMTAVFGEGEWETFTNEETGKTWIRAKSE